MRVKWLHLSDIHFNYKNYESHSLREDFLNRIQSLDQSEPFTHLFITGDILYRNAQADDDTIEFVKKLISIMRLSRESVFIIPGNHDHDRAVTQEVLARLFDGVKKKERDTKIDNLNTTDITVLLESQTNYNDACSKIFDEKKYSWNKPHFITIQDGISIINMNTSWLDSDSSSRADYLRIGSRLLQLELSNEEAQLGQSLNIAIGHHTLEDMLPQERNRVLDQFKRHNIGLYFCGHHHKPKIKYYDGYDVLEFVAPGGYNDGYSNGGYIWGIIDTDNDFYKAEVYGWYDNKWCIESKLDGTDEYGFYYFHTEKFDHNSNIVAIDCKTMNGHIPRRELERSIGDKRFDVHIYNGPVGNVNGYTLESIQDLARNIHELIEKNEIVHLYPLAPIPMLIALGFEIQSDTNITVHQFDRDTKSWVLSGEDWGAKLETSVIERNNNKVIAVSISTSYQIEKAQIEAAMGNVAYDYLEIKTDKITPGYPLFSNDVDSIAKNIILILNEKVNKYEEIHLFTAIPAGMAVELGRGMLKTVYSNIYTYQLTQGVYHHNLIINPRQNHRGKVISKNIEFVDHYRHNVRNLPIYGKIACGQKSEGDFDENKYFPILESILDNGDYFVLIAKGDSMINAGIEDGDYVIVKEQSTADDGDIVVALIEGETTLKRLFRDDKRRKIILHPENKDYSDAEYDELDIQGKAVRVIKKLR